MLQKLFKQTFIYGLATVLPRMLSFLLLPLYTDVLATSGFGAMTVIFSWFAIFNVILAYGMETAFFRFYHASEYPQKVISTALITLFGSTLIFVFIALNYIDFIAQSIQVSSEIIKIAIAILALDAWVIIPFALLRAKEKAGVYTVVKLSNVSINLGLNIFFLLLLPSLVAMNESSIWTNLYRPNFTIEYIFISNLIASLFTLLFLSRTYFSTSIQFSVTLWKQMMRYGLPVMVAGIAFTINEVFDKILLSRLLPEAIANSEAGKYAACYKLALFMTLFATAFRLGIEPFFFSHLKNKNPEKAYAKIMYYFVVFGSIIFLSVIVFIEPIKKIAIQNTDYWEAISVVPIILLASFFLGIYHNLSVWYKVTDKTYVGAYISIFGAIVTVVINYSYIPTMGYYASAIATLAAYGSMMILSFLWGRKQYYIPYDLKRIGWYLGITLLLSALSFYVFPEKMAWGAILLVVFISMVYLLEYKSLKKLRILDEN